MNKQNNLQDLYFFTVSNGVDLEKGRTRLSTLNRVGTLAKYQVYSERNGKIFSEIYKEIDPAVAKFIELTE